MKVLMLHVATDLYGSSKILYLVARKLCEEGHEVHLVVSEDGPLLELFNQLGAKTHVIRLGVLRKRYMNLKGLLNRVWVLITSYLKLRRLVKSEKIDLIYTNTTPVIMGGLLSKSMGVPNIWHLHEIMDPQGSLLHKIFAYIIKASSVRVIAVSDTVYNNWLPFIGNEKLKRIYNGIPIEPNEKIHSTIREELKLSPNDILIGMIGRLNLHKGQFYFLEIAKELISNNIHLKFIIVGDAFAGYEYLYEKLEGSIRSLGLENHVAYLGYRSDIPQIMKGLDVFVLPSVKPDPFPTVVLEAMSLSKPVVATAQGGALEQVLDKVTGLHIPIDDPKKAASIIQPLLEDKAMRENFGNKGKKRLESEFTLAAFETNISTLIHSIH
jgi:glycosyltransferase involved in cell wall biosynthesis